MRRYQKCHKSLPRSIVISRRSASRHSAEYSIPMQTTLDAPRKLPFCHRRRCSSCVVLLDAFQTIILPRRPVGRLRITRMFFLATWTSVDLLPRTRMSSAASASSSPLASTVRSPCCMLISLWAVLLIAAFGLIFYGLGSPFAIAAMQPATDTLSPPARVPLHLRAPRIFTLGLGDVTPGLPPRPRRSS